MVANWSSIKCHASYVNSNNSSMLGQYVSNLMNIWNYFKEKRYRNFRFANYISMNAQPPWISIIHMYIYDENLFIFMETHGKFADYYDHGNDDLYRISNFFINETQKETS